MSGLTAPTNHRELGTTAHRSVNFEPSRYDKVAAMLVTALILVGATAVALVIVWATTRIWRTTVLPEVELIEEIAGRGDAAMGSARDLEEPGQEEIEDLAEPQLQDTLTAVTDVISNQQATLDALEGDARSSTKGHGAGDSRNAGPGGEGRDIIPRWERWEIQYDSSALSEYAEKLQFFGVELAAFGGGQPQIDYATGLNKKKPDARRANSSEGETRIYFTWQHGPLRAADRELLRRAGISTDNRSIVQFYPPRVENSLAVLEDAEIKKRRLTLEQIQKTVFGVIGEPNAYEFRLISLQQRVR